jgi:hypothetical protein
LGSWHWPELRKTGRNNYIFRYEGKYYSINTLEDDEETLIIRMGLPAYLAMLGEEINLSYVGPRSTENKLFAAYLYHNAEEAGVKWAEEEREEN